MSDENKRDDVLLRMLKTPPQKHTAKSRAKRDADEITRKLDKGAGRRSRQDGAEDRE